MSSAILLAQATIFWNLDYCTELLKSFFGSTFAANGIFNIIIRLDSPPAYNSLLEKNERNKK